MVHTDELLKSLGNLYSELKREIHEMRKELKEIKNMLESLGQSTYIRTTSRGVLCVADSQIGGSTEAEHLLFAASRDSLANSSSYDGHKGVKEWIDNLVDEVKHLGVATDKVDKGSVVFTFTCGSLTSLLDLIYFFEDGRIQKHLEEIGSKLETILGRKVKLTAHMQPEALRGVLSLIKICTGYDGHQHNLDRFESGSVGSLAESSTVGQAVDFEQIRRTIQSTRKDRAKGVRGLQTTSTEYESDTTGYDSESTYASPTPPLNRRSVVHCPGRLKDGSMCNTVLLPGQTKCECCGKVLNLTPSTFEEEKCQKCGEVVPVLSEVCPECDFVIEKETYGTKRKAIHVGTSSNATDDVVCTTCCDGGRNVKAAKFCLDCQTYFCDVCLQQHNKFPTLKNHILLDKKQQVIKRPAVPLPSQCCSKHPGNIIQMYCKMHDAVCCTTCIALDHRLCKGIEYIPSIAKGTTKRKERRTTERHLLDRRGELKSLKSQILEHFSQVNSDKDETLKQVQTVKRHIWTRFDGLERKYLDQLQAKHQEIDGDTRWKVNALEDLITSLDTQIKKIANFSGENEEQLFIDIKCSHLLEKKCLDLLHTLKDVPIATLKNDFMYSFRILLNEMQSYISTCSDDVYKTPVDEYDISDICNITACCILDDGTTVITDTNNNRLKRLDHSYRVMDWLEVPGGPSGLCQVGQNEIAVSMYHGQKVQFASIGDAISLKGSFPVNEGCLGICYSQDKLFIVCTGIQFVGTACYMKKGTGQVRVYTLSGISVSSDGTNLYIADVQLGLIVLDRQGKTYAVITNPRLKDVFDVCLDDRDRVLVCGRMSHNVLLFEKHGKVEREMFRQTDGLLKPISVTRRQNSNHLIVSCENSEKIKVFKLK